MIIKMPTELKDTIEKELKSKTIANAWAKAYEEQLSQFGKEIENLFEKSRKQNKFELRDELTKELATKADLQMATSELRAEIGELRAEMKTSESNLRAEIGELRAEMKHSESNLRAEIKTSESTLRAEMKNLELKFNFKFTLIMIMIIIFSILGPKLSTLLLGFIPL